MEQVLLMRLLCHLPRHTPTAELRVSPGVSWVLLSPLRECPGQDTALPCVRAASGSRQVPCLFSTVRRTVFHIWNDVIGSLNMSQDFQFNGYYPQIFQLSLVCIHFLITTLCHALESLSDWFFIARSYIFLLRDSSP